MDREPQTGSMKPKPCKVCRFFCASEGQEMYIVRGFQQTFGFSKRILLRRPFACSISYSIRISFT